jgi:hypothetical protein
VKHAVEHGGMHGNENNAEVMDRVQAMGVKQEFLYWFIDPDRRSLKPEVQVKVRAVERSTAALLGETMPNWPPGNFCTRR